MYSTETQTNPPAKSLHSGFKQPRTKQHVREPKLNSSFDENIDSKLAEKRHKVVGNGGEDLDGESFGDSVSSVSRAINASSLSLCCKPPSNSRDHRRRRLRKLENFFGHHLPSRQLSGQGITIPARYSSDDLLNLNPPVTMNELTPELKTRLLRSHRKIRLLLGEPVDDKVVRNLLDRSRIMKRVPNSFDTHDKAECPSSHKKFSRKGPQRRYSIPLTYGEHFAEILLMNPMSGYADGHSDGIRRVLSPAKQKSLTLDELERDSCVKDKEQHRKSYNKLNRLLGEILYRREGANSVVERRQRGGHKTAKPIRRVETCTPLLGRTDRRGTETDREDSVCSETDFFSNVDSENTLMGSSDSSSESSFEFPQAPLSRCVFIEKISRRKKLQKLSSFFGGKLSPELQIAQNLIVGEW